MVERIPRRNPRIESIYTRVTKGDPDVTAKFRAVETYFRTIAMLPQDQRDQIEQPPELDFPLFLQASKDLDGRTPSAALRAAIDEVLRRGEPFERPVPEEKAEAISPPVDVAIPETIVSFTDDSTASVQDTVTSREEETPTEPTRAAKKTTTTSPEGSIKRSILFSMFPDLPRSVIIEVLATLPSMGTTSQGKSYRTEDAIRLLTETQAARAETVATRPQKRAAKARARDRQRRAQQRVERERTQLSPDQWPSRAALAAEYGIGIKTIDTLLSGLPDTARTIQSKAILYDRSLAAPILEAYAAQQRTEDRTYIRDEQIWVPIGYLQEKLHISYEKLRSELSGLPTKTEESRGFPLYPLDKALIKLDHLIDVPEADKTTGIATNADGHRLAPISVLAELLHTAEHRLKPYLDTLPEQYMRNRNRRIIPGYDIETVKQRIAAKFADAVELDPETKEYIDSEGNIYVTPFEAKQRLGLRSSKPIDRVIRDETIGIRHLSGKKPNSLREFNLYCLADLRQALGQADA